MGGLKVEQTADDRQVVLDPVMNFLQKRILPFFAGAQFSGSLFRLCGA
jgi:hypothetical protein